MQTSLLVMVGLSIRRIFFKRRRWQQQSLATLPTCCHLYIVTQTITKKLSCVSVDGDRLISSLASTPVAQGSLKRPHQDSTRTKARGNFCLMLFELKSIFFKLYTTPLSTLISPTICTQITSDFISFVPNNCLVAVAQLESTIFTISSLMTANLFTLNSSKTEVLLIALP